MSKKSRRKISRKADQLYATRTGLLTRANDIFSNPSKFADTLSFAGWPTKKSYKLVASAKRLKQGNRYDKDGGINEAMNYCNRLSKLKKDEKYLLQHDLELA